MLYKAIDIDRLLKINVVTKATTFIKNPRYNLIPKKNQLAHY